MQRKSTKNTRGPNQAEKNFQEWLKDKACCVTNDHGVQVHHCKGATFKHNKVLVGHWYCIPLTPEMHNKYHSGSKSFQIEHGHQSELWIDMVHLYELEGNTIPIDIICTIESLGIG